MINYATWDWLPVAASEMESYVVRLLEESGIKPHDVSARAKSIGSFQRKCKDKDYGDPMGQVTDIVAIRIITYSNTDRARSVELLRGRFLVKEGEDRNPGNEKEDRLRGYDCHHIVITGERPDNETDWLVAGGSLARYFTDFGGLEIQVRTVAGHAWAEFEHARRYKGAQYKAISEQDRGTIDQLLGAASDARRALDETFVAIDRILARPSVADESSGMSGNMVVESFRQEDESVALDESSLAEFLRQRFPEHEQPSKNGMEFGLRLLSASGLESLNALEAALDEVDSEKVASLMDRTVPVTQIRQLDDELLARFGEEYISRTHEIGSARNRAQQLEWRFDRLRGKARYRAYVIQGDALPEGWETWPRTAAYTVRELARLVGTLFGPEVAVVPNQTSLADDLPRGARAKEVLIEGRDSVWVTTNLSRADSEELMVALLQKAPPSDIRVTRDDVIVADAR